MEESVEFVFSIAFQNDETIAAYFTDRDPETWWFGPTSLGIGPNLPVPERPYVVWNEGVDSPYAEVSETSNARDRLFTFYVYDKKGDFTRINGILEAMRRVTKEDLAPFVAPDGTRCSRSAWDGMSGLIMDDGYDSCCRFGTVRLTVSR